MNRSKTYYIISLGCAKNQVDSELIIESLSEKGWKKASSAEEAYFIIVNTCGFIESAKEESINTLLAYQQEYPDSVIIAAGCLSERYSTDLAESIPELGGVFGNANISMVADYIDKLYLKETPSDSTFVKVPLLADVTSESFTRDDNSSVDRTVLLSRPGSAYIKITEGCNNNCSFCAIPVIRGKLRSRKIESIIKEITNMTQNGIKEINLVGQDLGSYGKDLKDVDGDKSKCLLSELLLEIEKIPGNFLIRMLYIHPDNFPKDILPICAKSRRIAPYFDIPFQHASMPVLSSMNRRGDKDKYLRLISYIREYLPDAVIRTTFMLGFPGEDSSDRDELEYFIKKGCIDWAGFFVYSREEDTPAFDFDNERAHKKRVKAAEKKLPELKDLQTRITEDRLKRFIGIKVDLLVEEAVNEEDLYLCRSWIQAPDVDGLVVLHADEGSLSPGDFVEAEIIAVNGIDLEAK
ncbi:MAG: 30S ribosomal protein S12 methylthiotransferase RimO [Spirochaetales bacterium]|nr:30S ribosomal protein S12 methylthiotransferase RimO [Spirochaetales bacterium]